MLSSKDIRKLELMYFNLTSSHFHGYQVPKDWLTSDSCYFYNVIFVSVSSKIQFLKKLRRSSKPIPENSKQEILYDFILGTCQYCLIHTACGLFLSSFTTLLVLDVSLSPSLSRPTSPQLYQYTGHWVSVVKGFSRNNTVPGEGPY